MTSTRYQIQKNSRFLATVLLVGSLTPIFATNVSSADVVADAGDNQPIRIGQVVHLDGTRSTAIYAATNVSYSWTLTTPAGSGATLSNAATPVPFFVADVAGDYVATLIMTTPEHESSQPSSVTFSTGVAIPVVNPGPVLHGTVGQTVTLDGSGSFDPNGQPLNFNWQMMSQPPGSRATLQGANTPFPTLMVDAGGDYSIALTVSNGTRSSRLVTTTVTTGIVPPRVKINASFNLAKQSLTLDLTKSFDPAGQQIQFQWSVLSKSPNSNCYLNNGQGAVATGGFTGAAPCIFEVVVNNSGYYSAKTYTVSQTGTPLTASAGDWQHVSAGQTVTLNGTNSSTEGVVPSYAWSFVWRPAGSQAVLMNSSSSLPSFVVDVAGDYLAQLTISDGISVRTATTLVTTLAGQPTATAPAAITTQNGDSVTLNAQADAAGGVLSSNWSLQTPMYLQPDAMPVITDVNPVMANFVSQNAGTYGVQYLVSNGRFLAADNTTVTVNPPRITTVTPPWVMEDTQFVKVVIRAVGASFVQGKTMVDFGSGIQVNSINVSNSNTVTATITVDNVVFGMRTITVTTGSQKLTNNQFTIAMPMSVLPASGMQGTDTSIEMTSSSVDPLGLLTSYDFGSGITAESSISPKIGILDAQLYIDQRAALGLHTMMLYSNNRLYVGTYTINPGHLAMDVKPQVATQGQSFAVMINGMDTHFDKVASSVNFGAGITVQQVSVKDAYSLMAYIVIAANAAGGPRTVTVTTGAETVSFTGFNVIAPVSLTSISPAVIASGTTTTLQISGANTHFVQGQTVARLFDCGGITVQKVAVTSATTASVTLSSPVMLFPSACSVALDSGSEQAFWAGKLNVAAFTVLSPASGKVGTTVTPTLYIPGAGMVVASVDMPQGITGFIMNAPGPGMVGLKFVIAASAPAGSYTILFPTDRGYYAAGFSVQN